MRKSEIVRDKLKKRIHELNLKYGSISKKLGKNHAYIHQYITRGVPSELPYEIRLPLAALLGWEEKDLRVNEISMPFGNPMAAQVSAFEEKHGRRYLSPAKIGAKEIAENGNINPLLVFEATQILNEVAKNQSLPVGKIRDIAMEAAEIASAKESAVTKNLILYLIEINK